MATNERLQPPPGYAEHASGLLVPTPYGAPLITRTPMFDDDGSGEVGTVLNNAWKQELYNQIDAGLAGTYSAAFQDALYPTNQVSITSFNYSTPQSFNDWAPPGTSPGQHWAIVFFSTADTQIGGFANGVPGQTIRIINWAAGNVYLWPNVASSAAPNRLFNFALSGNTPISYMGTATYMYFGGLGWKLIQHEQGQWIQPPFNAANFGAAQGTWTVNAGNIGADKYRVSGRTLSWSWNMTNTQLSASAGYIIRIAYGFSCANSVGGGICTANNQGSSFSILPIGGATNLNLYANAGTANFAAGFLHLYGSGSIEVT